ncbi:histidinol dehydrogenase [candidate division WOR-1 bacterium RIFOXYB2_FULL_42_35]|uniref:Histidinol dehydrogenase n=1 Tax=candidate division WOR-1 bacterium RIFOXYC2_FULL_41_25 TaxID=1802586 RepID=A0A1F4TK65_UNCSA|nr:MAG: histidinol dehydrogenase [candidate division WOR-1 bacterium RIFOXYA2_FULL_41_14]OGC22443.1 MAG: histidinol dehydrogenase [candidate division WOR-1 bacterium RIFOXYB2_FULL_42_35]OGC33121.1 MAG: histidinol dehydrogenase [candidate division WOR-1 bacterium RIFOXYC2_FULL_41_25]
MKTFVKEEIAKEVKAIMVSQRFQIGSAKEEVVKGIVTDVAKRGDKALLEYTKKFDDKDFSLENLEVPKAEIDAAYSMIGKGFREALVKAIQNITAYHQKQQPDEWFETLPLDVVLGQRVIPLSRVGIYVPGGKAVYPSSVLMNTIPAKVAGVAEIIMVSPPPISPYVLVAAAEAGVSRVFRVGGAQAIAALAFGTKTIPQVDKIVGPGNIYVTLAKKLVFGVVGIDSLAGPSNVVIIADDDAEPEFLAADLLSQAEHDQDSFAVLITDSSRVAEKTRQQLEKQVKKLKRQEIIEKAEIKIFLVDNMKEAIDICNQIAPEHLELQVSSPQRKLEKIKNAGAVFLGPHSPVPVGDYFAGPNHVLPTGGTARFASPLGVYDFVKTQSIVGYTKPALKDVWKDIKALAEVEGLDAHARAIDVRFS